MLHCLQVYASPLSTNDGSITETNTLRIYHNMKSSDFITDTNHITIKSSIYIADTSSSLQDVLPSVMLCDLFLLLPYAQIVFFVIHYEQPDSPSLVRLWEEKIDQPICIITNPIMCMKYSTNKMI